MRPIGSLFAHLAPCPDLLLASVGTSCHERAAFSDRSPPQSERAPAVGKSTRAERPTRGLLGGKDLLCAWSVGSFLLTPARGAPCRRSRLILCGGPCLAPPGGAKPRPQLEVDRVLEELRTPGPGSTQPPRVQRQHRAPPRRRPPLPAVRPAGPGGWRRPGRLHAPEAARTGPVSASRRSHVLMPRGGAGSTENGGRVRANQVGGSGWDRVS